MKLSELISELGKIYLEHGEISTHLFLGSSGIPIHTIQVIRVHPNTFQRINPRVIKMVHNKTLEYYPESVRIS